MSRDPESSLLRARVVRLPGGLLLDHVVDLLHEPIRCVPALGHDQHLGGDAVETTVHHFLRHEMLGLIAEVGLAPRTGHHDEWAHASQLAGDGLMQSMVGCADDAGSPRVRLP